jgi:hypothetical protein
VTSKTTFAMGTLVAAVPAAVLGFFLVGSFLNQLQDLQKQGTMFLALYGTTLAACAAVVFLPLGFLIFGPKSRSASKSSGDVPKPKSKAIKAATETGEQSAVEESLEPGMSGEFAASQVGKGGSTGELEIVEATPSMENLAAYDDEVMPPSGEIVAMEDDFDFDEEPVEPPKKKKGK